MERKSGIGLALALAVIAFGSGAYAVAEEAPSQANAEVEAQAKTDDGIPVSVAGMTVFVDEETGEFRAPTAEEAAVLQDAVQRMFGPAMRQAEAPEQATFAGGAVGVDLGLSQLAFSVATVAADGTLVHDCARTAAEAEAHVHDHAATPEEK